MENNELIAQCEARAKEWLSPAFDEETRKEVQAMLDNADKTDLIDAFYRDFWKRLSCGCSSCFRHLPRSPVGDGVLAFRPKRNAQ